MIEKIEHIFKNLPIFANICPLYIHNYYPQFTHWGPQVEAEMAQVTSPEVRTREKEKQIMSKKIGFRLLLDIGSYRCPFQVGINSFKVFMAYKDVFMLQ